jgi:hypothetical protein
MPRVPWKGIKMAQAETSGLLKEAAHALEAAHQRDGAVKIAFDMVERGKIPPFENRVEFEEKIASLMEKDLRVVEEALEMDAPMADFGKIASSGPAPTDAAAAFYHSLAED